ncbi:MAG: glutamine amidotransferase family protein [Hyphomicrobiaceae bacterium]|nr:glutamine amidotransferase family protein [Hyphomicrobiaceae bacterium]
MCGIVGLFLKNAHLEPRLGELTAGMLATMCERGPDSAGFAVYGTPAAEGRTKITLQSPRPESDFEGLGLVLARHFGQSVNVTYRATHAVVDVDADAADDVRSFLAAERPSIRVMGQGAAIEIYKEVGWPKDVADRFGLARMTGTHAIGHTRMATESAVTTTGAHPFSTGPDQCLVHNGSLSNHHNLRRALAHDGMTFATDNDSEVAAGYLTWRMNQGLGLGQALEKSLQDLDGFYTFVVGTRDGFGVLRDPIACKPAVLAETDDYVAFGSEYRALAGLPGIESARVWEPEPATVYFWERGR